LIYIKRKETITKREGGHRPKPSQGKKVKQKIRGKTPHPTNSRNEKIKNKKTK